MEGDQDQHWKCKRKKAKYQSSKFVDLGNATIDSEAFSVNDPSSTMPLTELAEQLNLQGISTVMLNDIFYGIASPSYLDTSSLPGTEDLTNNMEVVAAQPKSPKVHAPLLCLSSFLAPNFEPQKTISTFKKPYILQMCGALHKWLTTFSVEFSDDFSKLKNGVNMLMEELKGINAINTSILEGSINTFI
ncbi:hypothetical protein P3L10_004673 [Capsicum annuum]